MKKVRTFIACLLLICCFVPLSHTDAHASYYINCPSCGNQVYSEYTYCPYCSSRLKYAQTYGSWSSWSTTPVYATSSREVETRQVVSGYNMVHYGTQTASSPHYRMFRDYSIKGYFDYYGARHSYDEKHFTRYVPISAFTYAKSYAPGTLITGSYGGYQKGTSTAYNFGDDKYVWFINNAVYTTEYRYRNVY